ncbi:MAG TPA: hypothetical protein VFK57_11240 [Vicinamibacterales bacterium]|nr:hypothetical protein [Vicinamibacterales bacterium]
MKVSFALAMTLCAAALTAAPPAQPSAEDEVVVPQSDGHSGLCEPFDCATRIQQIFDASTFPSSMRIDALELFNDATQSAESFVEPAHYQVYLSTTRASSATLSADMDQNVGPNARLVAEFTVSDFSTFFTGAFRIPLAAPFVYARNAGNLLLEIRKDQTANYGDGTIYVDGSVQAAGVALATDQFGVQPSVGMSVGFVGQIIGPPER